MTRGSPKRHMRLRIDKKSAPYLFIAPFFVLLGFFMLGPTIYSFYLGFCDWSGAGPVRFVGLGNYLHLFADAHFIAALRNTLAITAFSVTVLLSVALFFAVLLNSKLARWRVFYRAELFAPSIMSSVVSVSIFQMIYSTRYGLLNSFLHLLGLPRIDWLGSPTWALPAVLLLLAWHGVGYNMVFFIAGLQGIPQECYEMAAIDGANAGQSFVHITFPLLRPMTIFVVTMTMISCFSTFAEPYLLTRGGPLDATLTLSVYLYRNAFAFGKLGYASAMAYIIGFMTLIVSIFYMRSSWRSEE